MNERIANQDIAETDSQGAKSQKGCMTGIRAGNNRGKNATG